MLVLRWSGWVENKHPQEGKPMLIIRIHFNRQAVKALKNCLRQAHITCQYVTFVMFYGIILLLAHKLQT